MTTTAFQAVWCLGEYRRRILLAHTNPAILEALQDAFMRAGFDVVLATDVTMALRCLGRHSFDLCIVQYDLSEKGVESRRTGEKVIHEFRAKAHPSYQAAWVLITEGDREVQEFEDAWRFQPPPVPIMNITPPKATPVSAATPFADVANRLLEFVKKRLEFFWDLPLGLEAATDEVRSTLHAVGQLRDDPLQVGDIEPSAREMLGEALRLAARRKEATAPVAAKARLLSEQGHASTIVLMSMIEENGSRSRERLIKVARAADGDREIKNFETYVQKKRFTSPIELLHHAQTIRGDLRVLLYNYIAYGRLTSRLRDPSSAAGNRRLIARLFDELQREWYSQGEWRKGTPRAIVQAWASRGAPLTGERELRDEWNTCFSDPRKQTFQWAAHGGTPEIDCEHIQDAVRLLSRSEQPCRDWRAITHGDLHPANVLVSQEGEVISLTDFSEISPDGSVLQDAAKFETDIVLKIVRPTSVEAGDQALMESLYGSLDLAATPSPADFQPMYKAGHDYVTEVRAAVARLLQAADDGEGYRELQRGYGLALLAEFIRRWRYMKEWEYTDIDRWRTLNCTDLVAKSLLEVI